MSIGHVVQGRLPPEIENEILQLLTEALVLDFTEDIYFTVSSPPGIGHKYSLTQVQKGNN